MASGVRAASLCEPFEKGMEAAEPGPGLVPFDYKCLRSLFDSRDSREIRSSG